MPEQDVSLSYWNLLAIAPSLTNPIFSPLFICGTVLCQTDDVTIKVVVLCDNMSKIRLSAVEPGHYGTTDQDDGLMWWLRQPCIE